MPWGGLGPPTVYIDAPPPASRSLARWIAWGAPYPLSQCSHPRQVPPPGRPWPGSRDCPEALSASVYLCALHPEGGVRAAVCAPGSGQCGEAKRWGSLVSRGTAPRDTQADFPSLRVPPCALRGTLQPLPKTPQSPRRKLRGHVYPSAEFGVPQPAACRNWPDPSGCACVPGGGFLGGDATPALDMVLRAARDNPSAAPRLPPLLRTPLCSSPARTYWRVFGSGPPCWTRFLEVARTTIHLYVHLGCVWARACSPALRKMETDLVRVG